MLKAASSIAKEKSAYVAINVLEGPDCKILKDMGKSVGSISAEIDPAWKYMRTAGFGGGMKGIYFFFGKHRIEFKKGPETDRRKLLYFNL